MDAEDLEAYVDEHDLPVKLAKVTGLKGKRIAVAEAFAAANE